jgi:hypothetical protein
VSKSRVHPLDTTIHHPLSLVEGPTKAGKQERSEIAAYIASSSSIDLASNGTTVQSRAIFFRKMNSAGSDDGRKRQQHEGDDSARVESAKKRMRNAELPYCTKVPSSALEQARIIEEREETLTKLIELLSEDKKHLRLGWSLSEEALNSSEAALAKSNTENEELKASLAKSNMEKEELKKGHQKLHSESNKSTIADILENKRGAIARTLSSEKEASIHIADAVGEVYRDENKENRSPSIQALDQRKLSNDGGDEIMNVEYDVDCDDNYTYSDPSGVVQEDDNTISRKRSSQESPHVAKERSLQDKVDEDQEDGAETEDERSSISDDDKDRPPARRQLPSTFDNEERDEEIPPPNEAPPIVKKVRALVSTSESEGMEDDDDDNECQERVEEREDEESSIDGAHKEGQQDEHGSYNDDDDW